ncbi:carbonic anhydrase [Prescottella subtropica]|uniref:carbonic anhydrase n=1 Tax=Prescottella subtropica TaxID=2545757 RepID=UPI0010F486A2|nr:carbonic anhydrase [Prescottella subtropica]
MPNSNPISAWNALKEGNERFLNDAPIHPNQGIEDRAKLVDGQHPTAVIFGCGDSRVAAELIFDQGLGDSFVVRTAGHVVDSTTLGSIEFGVELLNTPLIVVLGHDSCGAVKATLDALDNVNIPGGFIRDIVERVTPSILKARQDGVTEVDEFVGRHVMETAELLMQRSRIIADAVEAGKCAIVGVTYKLADGGIKLRGVIGDIGETVA